MFVRKYQVRSLQPEVDRRSTRITIMIIMIIASSHPFGHRYEHDHDQCSRELSAKNIDQLKIEQQQII